MKRGEVTAVAGSGASGQFCGALIDALAAAVYTTDAEGVLTYANEAAIKLTGRAPEIGRDRWSLAWKLFLPDGTPLAHEQYPMAIALEGGDVPAGQEFIGERPDGSRFWFTTHPAVGRDPEGRITAGIDVLEDITARKAAPLAADEQFRVIVDTTPECVKIVDRHGTLLHMNASGLAMIGASSADAVIGKKVYDLIAPEDRERYRAFNERVCAGEKASLEFEIVSLNGTRRLMETHAAPLKHVGETTVQLAITRDITARKGAERATLLLGAIVDSSDDAIISKDLHGIITSWNTGAERLFGYTAAEAVGRPVTMLMPPERLDEEPQILSRLKRGERVDHFETVRRSKDGTLLDISLTISPVKDARGVIVGASKIARNITERKRAESAIQQLNAQLTADLAAMTRLQQLSTRLVQPEDFYQLLAEIIDTGIEITHAEMGNIQLVEDGSLKIVAQRGFDPAYQEFFGTISAGQAACGTAWECGERIVVEDVANSPLFADPALRDGMLAAGVRAVQATPLCSRSGQVLGVFSTHYRSPRRPGGRELRLLDILARLTADLMERNRAETALLQSEGRFRQLADAMPQIVWTARPDGHLDYYNQRWYEFTGFDRDRFGDLSWEPVLHPEDVKAWREAWYDAVESGRPYSAEYRFWDRAEHRWRWFVARALPIRDNDGRIVKWFGSSTDIDEQKRVEDDLRRANQDLEQFAFSASHDLQEPLRSIQIYGELLTNRCGNQLDEKAREYLGYVRGGATRLESLVRDLLAYTQVTKVDRPAEPTDAGEALQTVLAGLAGSIAEIAARVTADPLPAVPVHAAHLQLLFQNLIGNALKYRSAQRTPEVHVSAERRNGYWIFSVSDNGIGIAPEFREKVFGLFKRLHRNHEYSGTGIGLAICQRIVDRYHGKIWVESEVGQGSTFRFTLPQ